MDSTTTPLHDVVGLGETPQEIFDALDRIFHFTLDACASVHNHKCAKFYTADDNSLEKSWQGERVYCNPPARLASQFVYKAIWETRRPDGPGALTVVIVPDCLDTRPMIELHAAKKVMPPLGQLGVLDAEGRLCNAIIAVFEP